MKLTISLALAFAATTSAFVAIPQNQPRLAPLEATKGGGWKPVVSGAIVGWTLATRIATAADVPPPVVNFQPEIVMMQTTSSNFPSTMLSLGAYQPETGYDSLDMSLPSYKVEELSTAKDEPNVVDPAKEEERNARIAARAKAAAEKNQTKEQVMLAKKQAKAKDKAEADAIKARVAAGRQATRDAKMAAKQQ